MNILVMHKLIGKLPYDSKKKLS